MKKIKIFAAAGSGMTEDIKKLENFVGLLNVMHEGSACLIVYKDNASVEEELRRAEAEIAADIDQADYFALILGRDADDRAIAELFRAAERLKKRENKDTSENSILKDKDVAAKSASVADTLQAKDALKNKDIKEIKSINVYLKKDGEDDAKILAILDKFSAEPLKHYVERYSEIDTLKLKILIQLSAGENEFGESDDYSLPVLKYEIGSDDNGDPIVLIGKTPVLGLVSYDALLNSGSYRRSKRSVSELEAELEEVSERARIEQKKGSLIAGGLWTQVTNINEELKQKREECRNYERDVVDFYRHYAENVLRGKVDQRLTEAKEYIEAGMIDAARKVLDANRAKAQIKDGISEKKINESRIATLKAEAETNIELVKADIDALKVQTDNKNRFKEIREHYEFILDTQREYGLEKTELFEYAEFLYEQRDFKLAAERYEEYINEIKGKKGGEHEYNYFSALNNLANTQNYLNRFSEAGKNYAKLLEICRGLAENNREACIEYVGMTLNNLAVLQCKIKRYEEAEKNFTEALGIRRGLAEKNREAYIEYVGDTLNNLANLQSDIEKNEEAEKNYTEALGVYRGLAEKDRDAYIDGVGDTLNNLAILQSDIGQYEEAEKNYIEALDIRRGLAEKNREAHIEKVGATLVNLAVLQININQYGEAEKNFTEALEIYRGLADKNREAYIEYVGTTLYNLAKLQNDRKKYKEAEKNYTEALDIRRGLAEKNREAYIEHVGQTLNNLANLQSDIGKHDEAEKNYAEALEIRRGLAEKNREAYIECVRNTLNNLAILYGRQGKYAEAEIGLLEALAITNELIQKNAAAYLNDFVNGLNGLALVQIYLGKKNDAREHLNLAILGYEQLNGTGLIDPNQYAKSQKFLSMLNQPNE